MICFSHQHAHLGYYIDNVSAGILSNLPQVFIIILNKLGILSQILYSIHEVEISSKHGKTILVDLIESLAQNSKSLTK